MQGSARVSKDQQEVVLEGVGIHVQQTMGETCKFGVGILGSLSNMARKRVRKGRAARGA